VPRHRRLAAQRLGYRFRLDDSAAQVAGKELRVSVTVQGKVVRPRPLCAYLGVAKYKGSGSIDDAANFSCGKQ
jgi:hypothetical protein